MRRKKRTNLEILEDLINECCERLEKLDLDKEYEKDSKRIHDLDWDSTNLSGTISAFISKVH